MYIAWPILEFTGSLLFQTHTNNRLRDLIAYQTTPRTKAFSVHNDRSIALERNSQQIAKPGS